MSKTHILNTRRKVRHLPPMSEKCRPPADDPCGRELQNQCYSVIFTPNLSKCADAPRRLTLRRKFRGILDLRGKMGASRLPDYQVGISFSQINQRCCTISSSRRLSLLNDSSTASCATLCEKAVTRETDFTREITRYRDYKYIWENFIERGTLLGAFQSSS